MTLATLASAALLAMTPLAAAAQGQPAAATGPVDLEPPRFEAGASASIIGIFPGFGGLVSVPAGRRLSLEAGVETFPWVIEDGDDLRLLTQVQARIPWKVRPGTRWSVVAGVTAATVGDKDDAVSSGDWRFQSTFFPHGGVSWQWRTSARVDVRLDLTGMVAVVPAPVPIPRLQFSTVWHPKGDPR